ncbi:hypothetical protein BD311DRAFT_767476 [Dichomitus squalens]|uniref:Uncharacterized protein n=1 Tax=Dichomitus squalens TaxID=114155 RepID=A0A4Q9MC95_9APHY|nr:hypothetical protein BD311DRAFT_767476 [Dichomitus squalens]
MLAVEIGFPYAPDPPQDSAQGEDPEGRRRISLVLFSPPPRPVGVAAQQAHQQGCIWGAVPHIPCLLELKLECHWQQREVSNTRTEVCEVLAVLAEIRESIVAPGGGTEGVHLPGLRVLRFEGVFWSDELLEQLGLCQQICQSHGAAPVQVDLGNPRK